jgi:hypothetical protein
MRKSHDMALLKIIFHYFFLNNLPLQKLTFSLEFVMSCQVQNAFLFRFGVQNVTNSRLDDVQWNWHNLGFDFIMEFATCELYK